MQQLISRRGPSIVGVPATPDCPSVPIGNPGVEVMLTFPGLLGRTRLGAAVRMPGLPEPADELFALIPPRRDSVAKAAQPLARAAT